MGTSYTCCNNIDKNEINWFYYDLFMDKTSNCSEKRIIKDCKCIIRVFEAIKYYHTLNFINNNNNNNNNNDKNKLIKFVKNIYNHILDDYIHIITIHNDFIDDIYSLLNSSKYNFKKCNIIKCILTQRHNRNREQNVHSNEIKYNNNDDDDDTEFLFFRDIYDSIHFYLFHIYEFGFRITKKEKNKFYQQIQEKKDNNDDDINCTDYIFNNIKRVINEKRKKLPIIDRFNANKFNINNNEEKNNCNDDNDDHVNGTYIYIYILSERI